MRLEEYFTEIEERVTNFRAKWQYLYEELNRTFSVCTQYIVYIILHII